MPSVIFDQCIFNAMCQNEQTEKKWKEMKGKTKIDRHRWHTHTHTKDSIWNICDRCSHSHSHPHKANGIALIINKDEENKCEINFNCVNSFSLWVLCHFHMAFVRFISHSFSVSPSTWSSAPQSSWTAKCKEKRLQRVTQQKQQHATFCITIINIIANWKYIWEKIQSVVGYLMCGNKMKKTVIENWSVF